MKLLAVIAFVAFGTLLTYAYEQEEGYSFETKHDFYGGGGGGGGGGFSQGGGGGFGEFGGQGGGGFGGGGSFEGGHHYPKYKYKYGVKDHHTGDFKDAWEHRHGDHVEGGYSLAEPDGTHRIVKYKADGKSGFNAIVKTIGKGIGGGGGYGGGSGGGYGKGGYSYQSVNL